jgi:hypothetical protein
LSGRRNLPRVYANQVFQDISTEELNTLIASNELESSHGSGFFGISYRHSLRAIKDSPALVLQFDILEIWSDLPETPLLHKLENANQKLLELVLLKKPVYSALEPPTFEIIKAELVLRSQNPVAPTTLQQTMHFLEWDAHGRKGTTAHALTSFGIWLIDYLDSGVWAMFMFILAIILLFVVVCVLCVFGWGFWEDDYAQAQHGKAREGKRRGKSDVENAARLPFKSAEELGLSRGRVVGLGKSD